MKKTVCAALAAIIALSAAGCGKKPEKKEEAAAATNVTVCDTEAADVLRIVSYTGEITAGEWVSINPKVSAKISSIFVEEGDYVKAGTVLAVLDDTDIRLSYNQAAASYNSANAAYDMTANASTKQAETAANQNLSRAQIEYDDAISAYNRQKELYDNDTSIVAAQNALNDANDNLERTKQLYELGSVSKVVYDGAQTAQQNAAANLESTRSNVKTAMESAKTRVENAKLNLASAQENRDLQVNVLSKKTIASSKAAAESAKAALAIAENNLANTRITAPIEGYVASKNVTVGQMASPGAEMFSLKNTNMVEAEINVTEADIPYVQVGTAADVTVKSSNLETISGTVTAVNPTKDEKTGLYNVKVSVPNSDGAIKAGMFADIALTLQKSENTISVPTESVIQNGSEYYVFVASKDGKTAEKRVVTKGIENAETTEILKGVSLGDKVIIKGREYLSEKNNSIKIVD